MRELERERNGNRRELPALALDRRGTGRQRAAARGRDAGLEVAARRSLRRRRRRLRRRRGGAALRSRRRDRGRLRGDRRDADSLRFVGHTSGATGAEPLRAAAAAGPRHLRPAPAADDPRRRLGHPRRAPARSAAPTEAALELAATLAERARHASLRAPEDSRAAYHAAAAIASNFLVALRSRPPSCSSAAGDRGRARAAGAARPAQRRQLGRARRCGADRPDRPRRRGDGRAPPRGDRRARPGAGAALPGARRAHPRPGGRSAQETAHEDRAHQGGAAGGARRRRAARAARSASCRRWAPCTTATSRCCGRRASRVRRRRHEPVRQPGPVRPGEDLDRYPRDEAPRRASSPRQTGVDLIYAPARERGLPGRASPPRSRSRASPRSSAAIPSGAGPSTSAASRRSSPSSSTRSSPTSPTSARRTPSRRS